MRLQIGYSGIARMFSRIDNTPAISIQNEQVNRFVMSNELSRVKGIFFIQREIRGSHRLQDSV